LPEDGQEGTPTLVVEVDARHLFRATALAARHDPPASYGPI